MISRVKICGITCLEDAENAILAGASALGFVFYAPSPRYIQPAQAAEIISQLPPFITSTALFVNEESATVNHIIDVVKPDLLQFHGAETVAYCDQFTRPYIKAVRVKDGVDIEQIADQYASARALLLDTYVKGVPGGTGELFNWQLIPQVMRHRIILAGGLDENNVAQAIATIQPFAVDVSGGVESSPGKKSVAKINEFMASVREANEA